MSADTSKKPASVPPNAENLYQVGPSDLPLSCPMPGMTLWDSHPRVYLPIEKTGSAKCPYCGAEFQLQTKGDGSFQARA